MTRFDGANVHRHERPNTTHGFFRNDPWLESFSLALRSPSARFSLTMYIPMSCTMPASLQRQRDILFSEYRVDTGRQQMLLG